MPIKLKILPHKRNYKSIFIFLRKNVGYFIPKSAGYESNNKFSSQNIIYKGNSDHMSLYDCIKYEEMRQNDLREQIYDLLTTYSLSIRYSNKLELEYRNIHPISSEPVYYSEESVDICEPKENFYSTLVDKFCSCLRPANNSCMSILKGI